MIVVDTSVLVGFVLPPDAYHAEANACRDRDADWHAPFLTQNMLLSPGGSAANWSPRIAKC